MTASTLQPSPLISNATSLTTTNATATQTVVVPVSTFETIVASSATTTVAVQGNYTVTSSTIIGVTVTSDGSTYTTVSGVPWTLTATATALSETTIAASSVSTGTIVTTITVSVVPTVQPTAGCQPGMYCSAQDLFLPIAIAQPPSIFSRQSGHPVPRTGINHTGALETNKFYANFYLGSQSSPAFVTPYSLAWSKGSGNAMSWGMAVSHMDASAEVFGPANTQIPGTPASYYINPLGIQHIIFSAAELGTNTILTTDALGLFSVNVHLAPAVGDGPAITMPVVQGMGFVTAIYNNVQPLLQSSVFFRTVLTAESPKSGVFKYEATLEDGKIWLIYVTPSNGFDPNFQLTSSTILQGLPNWSGVIQVAKNPGNASDAIYDAAAGAYPTGGAVSGYALASSASYSLSWTKGGPFASNASLLMFALPHHVQSFASNTADSATSLQLETLTKGIATAISADYWVFHENSLPTDMGFAPWRPEGQGNVTVLSASAIATIQNVSAVEASQNMSALTDLNSMYYSGKALSKFATICYVMHDLAGQQNLSTSALVELKSAFNVFVNNQQPFPLLYDSDWKGVVSSASYVTGDAGQDFGNSYYNDHHFHYGYFLHAAAVIGHLDPTWLATNKDYVNALARDVSNPSALDQYFPIFRYFDWYNGHSWAHGLFESGDGKDEESSSEDAMFAYGLKMWGKTIGDPSMEGRGNLMLSVLSRSLQNYFLMESDNQHQPAQFIGNKAAGITFENKVDHATYFGLNLEYIEGIHMLPLMPFSTLTRTLDFVAEEWATYFADGAVDPASNVQGGWKGILYANFAIINPTAAWNFFADPNFDPGWLDGGASRTWYLAFAAGLGGSP